MVRQRLTNDNWGLESNCFVCEASNVAGLQLKLHADPETGLVDAEVQLGDAYSGAPMVVHGGISLAILDEVQAWAAIALGQQWAVTVETSARFHQPVWIDHPYRVVAEITGRDGDRIMTAGRIVDVDGEDCVTSTAVLQTIGEATAKAWAGAEVSDGNRRYLREGDST